MNEYKSQIDRIIIVLRELCSDCKTPEQSGTVHGYTCPKHYLSIYGKEMPTLGEVRNR